MAKLNEGMRPADLEDLVLPMISIDEYESKIDDNAVVIGFYVGDESAAQDLNRFIQKSPVVLLDTEVSPAPDQHGYYLVFVELLNDIRIVTNIEAILEEVSPLMGDEEWQMRLRGYEDGVIPFSTKVLTARFNELRSENVDGESEDVGDGTEGRVLEFFTPSDLSNVIIENNRVHLVGGADELRADLVEYGETETLMSHHGLNESAMSLDLTDIALSLKMTRLLGEGWMSSRFGDSMIIQHVGSESCVLLRNARFV